MKVKKLLKRPIAIVLAVMTVMTTMLLGTITSSAAALSAGDTIYIKSSTEYANPYIYVWSGSGNNSWPGKAMESLGKEDDGYYTYAYQLPIEADQFIFMRGSSGDSDKVTGDVTITPGFNCYNLDSQSWSTYGANLNVNYSYDQTQVVLSDQVSKAKEGDTVSFTVTAKPGYKVTSVTVGNELLVGTDGKYSFTMPAEDVTVLIQAVEGINDAPAAVLDGSKVMFYVGNTWGSTYMYVRSADAASVVAEGASDKYLAVLAAPAKYYLSNSSTWDGVQMTQDAAAGYYYELTSSGYGNNSINNIPGASISSSALSETAIEKGTASVTVTSAVSQQKSSAGLTQYVLYYVDGAAVYTAKTEAITGASASAELDTSALSVGEHTILPVLTDGVIYSLGTPVTLQVEDVTEPTTTEEPTAPTEEPTTAEPTTAEPTTVEPTGSEKQFTVTAKSNICTPVSQTYNEKDQTVTVTYLVKTDRKVVEGEWRIDYDPAVLKFNRAAMTDEEGLQICSPVVEAVGGYQYNLFDPEGEAQGIAKGNFSSINKLYDFTQENIEDNIFFRGTFDIVGDYTADTEIDFNVRTLTVGERDQEGELALDMYVELSEIKKENFTELCETKIVLSGSTDIPSETTEPTTVTEPTTETEPTTVTEPTTETEPTTVTEPTTETEPTTATEPQSKTIYVGVISYVYDQTASNESAYQVHYWNDSASGDAVCTPLNMTLSKSVGSEYWSGSEQTFYMYSAEIPAEMTGYKFHIGDTWFGGDGDTAASNTVYAFNYSGDKAEYVLSTVGDVAMEYKYTEYDASVSPVYDPENAGIEKTVEKQVFAVYSDDEMLKAQYIENAPTVISVYYAYALDTASVQITENGVTGTLSNTPLYYNVAVQPEGGESTLLEVNYQNTVTLNGKDYLPETEAFTWYTIINGEIVYLSTEPTYSFIAAQNTTIYVKANDGESLSSHSVIGAPSYEVYFTEDGVEKVNINLLIENYLYEQGATYTGSGVLYYVSDESGNLNGAAVTGETLIDSALANTNAGTTIQTDSGIYNRNAAAAQYFPNTGAYEFIYSASLTSSEANQDKFITFYSYMTYELDGHVYAIVSGNGVTASIRDAYAKG